MRISVAFALASRQEVVELSLAEGASVADAIRAARLAERFPGIDFDSLEAGVWNVRCARDAKLREGDRVELYRPLAADPKDQRRRRARPRTSPRSRSAP
ncbi:MAG TPA: RnfH family protein [Usitatibacter sp.]|nr:RnfH family protein [Usitatibacter sp.]